jgi:hypothetical protein
MILNFAEVLAGLGQDAGFRIANEVQPASNYAFTALLPELTRFTYDVKQGKMIVRSVMAGMVGMDSAYPPGAMAESSRWHAETAKLAIENYLPEESLRYMQDVLRQTGLAQGASVQFIANEALNFLQKVVIQPLTDAQEWLRGQALSTGALTWTFNGKTLNVDYGVPAANKITPRTTGNADWYGHATTSKFWDDILTMRRLLRYNVRGVWLNSRTADTIMMNQGNNARLITNEGGILSLHRIIVRNGVEVLSDDARERITFNIYDGEGEVLDPANPNSTKILKFLPDGKIIAVGNTAANGYRVGEGSTPNSNVNQNTLGYTHIGPTVEAGGRPGRWAELYTPEGRPWQLNGRGVVNTLPVIENPEKIVIMETDVT